MTQKKKGLLFGDHSNPKYHSIAGIDKEIAAVFGEEAELVCTEDYGELGRADFDSLDFIVTYADRWNDKTTKELVDAVLSFVSGGGGFLVIHNGIIMSDFELAMMVGGKFTQHPPLTKLMFSPTAEEHPMLQGIVNFELNEEPYQFDFDPFTEKTVLLEYTYDGKQWPAAWAQSYGKGRVAYLAPGHNVAVFQSEMFRNLIRNSFLWVCQTV